MKKITLNELIGVKVRKLYSASELMYIYELYKYTQELLGKELDLTGISVIKELKNSEYAQYLYHKGFDLNFGLSLDSIGDITEVSRKFFNSDLTGIVFETQTADEWVYDYNTDRSANIILNRYNRSAGYVSLYAYMVVLSYKNKKKVPKLILKNTSHKQEEFEYVDILILKLHGNKLLDGKVDLIYSRDLVTQPEWEAYIIYHRQIGKMNKECTALEKFKYISKEYQVGDVVLYYKTDKAIKSKTIRRLMNCHPAVIRGIGKNEIKITYYPDITTLLTRRRLLEHAEEVCDYKYPREEYSKFPACSVTIDYFNLGVDDLLYAEDEFLFKPLNGTDTFEQYIVDANGVEGVYTLGTLDTIYAVFEDRGIEYNKEKFLNTYFKKTKPIYDEIVGR